MGAANCHVLHQLDLIEGDPNPFRARFIEAIPWNPAATDLRVRNGGDVIGALPLAAAPPGAG
jgi:hypothetical protein